MKTIHLHCPMLLSLCLLVWCVHVEKGASQSDWGMSHHGSHYDQGPRYKPWIMNGIGTTHFPVTSNHPEVQKWFDQGNTLLHGFWEFEAERSFRWCLKLDPECAMAYWGLARCCRNNASRERKFFKEAVKRKGKVSKRERDYIEVWEAKYAVKKSKEKKREKAIKEYVKRFDNLLINYPDDVEARALYWLELPRTISKKGENSGDGMRYALDRVLKEVLAKEPNHVGALHYIVHNWDGDEGHYALDACMHLSKVAPQCGHLQHMPGHVLSSIGLWNEAAIAMDSATRVEKTYMQQRMILPEQNWDYIHNLDYLAYIQEQLGMFEAARISCEQLLSGPPPASSPIGNFANWSMARSAVKFEKWEEILDENCTWFRWDEENFIDSALRAYIRCHAHIGLGQIDAAKKELRNFESKVAIVSLPKIAGKLFSRWSGSKKPSKSGESSNKRNFIQTMVSIRRWELQGKLAIASGDRQKGLELLRKAAEMQKEDWRNDPPMDAVFIFNTIGDFHLEDGNYEQAIAAFEETLSKVINDGFALSGMVVALSKQGQTQKAGEYMAKLRYVWKNADRSNRWLTRALQTGVKPSSSPKKLMAERDYKATILDKLGHSIWSAPAAPKLSAINCDGKTVSLDDYRGKNVILIFYLGDQCLHCMEQIQQANELASQFTRLNTEILAISKDDVKTIREYQESPMGITLLSDPEFSNAKRFRSYDEFEEIELHSTLLIDANGRVHWSQHGGDPFMDFDFLKNEIGFLNSRKSLQTAQGR